MKVKVKSYETPLGIFWKVVDIETEETVDDGFDSTADAELYCFDENLDYGDADSK